MVNDDDGDLPIEEAWQIIADLHATVDALLAELPDRAVARLRPGMTAEAIERELQAEVDRVLSAALRAQEQATARVQGRKPD